MSEAGDPDPEGAQGSCPGELGSAGEKRMQEGAADTGGCWGG